MSIQPNLLEIQRALGLLFRPDDCIELRCIGGRATLNGFFLDHQKLSQAAYQLSEAGENVFICLNPVRADLYPRSADAVCRTAKGGAASDADVLARRWLLIDIDSDRPKGTSATAEQLAAADRLAQSVYRQLGQLQLPMPIVATSGNGYHLLLPLADLRNDEASRWACERFLARLAQDCQANGAHIDQAMFNAARIATLPGTVKRKGSDLPTHPHRLAKILSCPDRIERASLDQLLAIVGPPPALGQQHPSAQTCEGSWDLEALLRQRGLQYEADDQLQTATGETAKRFILEVCPFEPEHQNSACLLQFQSGAVAFRCLGNRCQGKGWPQLKELWGLPAAGGISAADIVLPATPRTSQTSQQCYTTNQTPLQSYIEPPVPAPECFYGPLGQIAQGIASDTEAAPIAVLACSLTLFGNAVGRCCYVTLDQPHFPKLYVALVGATGSGRKGTADYQARQIIDSVDPTAALLRHGGLSTGEGLLEILDQNRDGIYPRPACFIEREFCAVFRRAERKGNTLSAYVRDAWDGSPLENTIKAKPLRIDDHHISLCAHITPAELKKLLLSVDIANGYSNRILWFFCRRAERRPRASGFQPGRFRQQIQQLQSALAAAREQYSRAGQPVEVAFSAAAQQLWDSRLYAELDIDSDQDTQLILMTSRQAQQACRLALILALADGRTQIEPQHLTAASAIVAYVYESLDYVFSQSWWGDSGCATDPAGMAPKVLQALQAGPLTRWQIRSAVLHRHHTAREINQLRDLLLQQGRIRVEQQPRQELWGLPEV